MPQDIGRSLYEAGWVQGKLFSPLAASVVFAPGDPISKLARSAAARAQADHTLLHPVTHGVAYGIPTSTERLVVVSQACDIAKPPSVEPNVLAMPVFKTENVRILGPAARNSSRYFLLDAGRGYVVDAISIIVIEKPLLMTLTPEVGAQTSDEQKRFARWLARRFNRPAIADDIVVAIVKPILENLRSCQAQGALDMDLVDRISEVRLLVANDRLPFTFDLLFMVEENDIQTMELALAPLLGEMRGWFTPELAVLRAWYARSYADVSVADYFAAEQLYLDEYSYDGVTLHGLVAPDPA
ncbi:MAG TPA: hypothetical protein VME66_00170 [Candidatus Acidoferrales bacterium]|nr:hypothetical protein [Candidatus Acidoferrales bacterium]